MSQAYKVVKDLENALSDYTGAPYVVTVNSCTSALFLALRYYKLHKDSLLKAVEIPYRTYISVPQAAIHAGFKIKIKYDEWKGEYKLSPTNIIDSARTFTSMNYFAGTVRCVSFHATKILGDTQGGAILLDDIEQYEWLLRARFDGRTIGVPAAEDMIEHLGYHCYMSPDVAARLLMRLSYLDKNNYPLDNDDYPNLTKIPALQQYITRTDKCKW